MKLVCRLKQEIQAQFHLMRDNSICNKILGLNVKYKEVQKTDYQGKHTRLSVYIPSDIHFQSTTQI